MVGLAYHCARRPCHPDPWISWLAHCAACTERSTLTLERVVEVRSRLGLEFDVPVIAVAGTNGKGSTCAMLEAIACRRATASWAVCQAAPRALRGALPRGGAAWWPPRELLPHFEAVEAARGGESR